MIQHQESIADLILFDKLVDSIQSQPSKYRIKIKPQREITSLMQVYGQFYKLADVNEDLIGDVLRIANMEPDDFYRRYNTREQHILAQFDPFRSRN